ncbi:MAG: rod-binding protein [Planctomycetota bacterium]
MTQFPGMESTVHRAALPGRSPQSVADGFESLFVFQMLEPLEKSGASFFGEGAAGRTFSGMFRQILADQIAKSRPLGIAKQIERSLAEQDGRSSAQPSVGPRVAAEGENHG